MLIRIPPKSPSNESTIPRVAIHRYTAAIESESPLNDHSAMQLPFIDLETFERADERTKNGIGKDLDQICAQIGFFQVTGHAVPARLIAATAASARAFFARPLEEKLTVKQPTPRTIRGYIPMGRGALAYTRAERSPPDYKQSFSIGPPSESGAARDDDRSGAKHYEVNLWPAQPPDFQSTCTEYYYAMETLSSRLLNVVARALGVRASQLQQTVEDHVSVLGLAHYPAQHEATTPGQLRCGAHSDFGTLTVLWPEFGLPGLEVLDKRDQWQTVTSAEDAFVVNIGDVLERWTHGRWRSTLHRVVNPPADSAACDRLSLGYFQHPNPRTPMTSLASRSAREGKPADSSNTFGAYLDAKFSSQVRGSS